MKTRGGLLLLPLLILCSCVGGSNPHVKEDMNYEEYENAFGGMKGTEIYCWKYDDGYWCCGALLGTNRLKTYEEIHHIQAELPCTLEKMKEIIAKNNADRETVIVFDIPADLNEQSFSALDLSESHSTSNIPYLYSSLGLI